MAGPSDAHQRVMLARKFFRWSKQLYVPRIYYAGILYRSHGLLCQSCRDGIYS